MNDEDESKISLFQPKDYFRMRRMTKVAFYYYGKRIQFVAVKVDCFCKRFRHESSKQENECFMEII